MTALWPQVYTFGRTLKAVFRQKRGISKAKEFLIVPRGYMIFLVRSARPLGTPDPSKWQMASNRGERFSSNSRK